MMKAYEMNFDGIVGPTHHYAGLSYGNIASIANEEAISNPREAALQGLNKMLFLHRLGVKQAVLPPHERPNLAVLHSLGFDGKNSEILQKVQRESPKLLSASYSAAAMWTANAATVSPSSDCEDRRVHFTPANLTNKFHRSLEAATTEKILGKIFFNADHFCVHSPLPPVQDFSDEGAANHLRFCNSYNDLGVELFVYGREAFTTDNVLSPSIFPARQTLEASQAVARRHLLRKDKVIFAQQNPEAIDAGVFHNDVISVSNQNVFFYHEQAFVDTPVVIDAIQNAMAEPLHLIRVDKEEVSLADAVASYLFNSQIVTLDHGEMDEMVMIAPQECQEIKSVKEFCESMQGDVIKKIFYLNLRESMCNGGGPACLRLRVVLTAAELSAINSHVLFDEKLYKTLTAWVHRYYRDKLTMRDMADPLLLKESMEALDALTQILHLGSIYSFQRDGFFI